MNLPIACKAMTSIPCTVAKENSFAIHSRKPPTRSITQFTNEPTCCLKELRTDAPVVCHVSALVALWVLAWQVNPGHDPAGLTSCLAAHPLRRDHMSAGFPSPSVIIGFSLFLLSMF